MSSPIVKLELDDGARVYEWVKDGEVWRCVLTQQHWEYRPDLDCESLAEVGVTMLELIERG